MRCAGAGARGADRRHGGAGGGGAAGGADRIPRPIDDERLLAEPGSHRTADTRRVGGVRGTPGQRQEGRIEFRGPSTTSGYWRNPEATARLIRGGWLDSGDRGYIAAGEVHITGRVKDIIIRAGRNLYPQELEEAVGEIPGIRKGCVAVFGAADRATGTEKL